MKVKSGIALRPLLGCRAARAMGDLNQKAMPATAAASDERKTLHSHGAVARCSPKYSGTSRRTWRGHVGRLRDLPLSAPRPARAGALRQIALDERLKIQVPEGINLVALPTLNRRLSTPSRAPSDSNQLIVRSGGRPLLRNDGAGQSTS